MTSPATLPALARPVASHPVAAHPVVVTSSPASGGGEGSDEPADSPDPATGARESARSASPLPLPSPSPLPSQPRSQSPAPLPDVRQAARYLAGVARRTPVAWAGQLCGPSAPPIWLKCENSQHTGSFKLRGAYARIAAASPAERARGVVAASAGNHAQGVAYAAAKFGVQATVFVPSGANPVKVARTRRWGARLFEVPGTVEDALAVARTYADEGGRLFVHPFDDPMVMAGQGTVGLELLEQLPGVETVLVGVGGGGLACGVAAAVRAAGAEVRVIGVQAAGAPAFAASLRAGRLVTAPARTVADGMAVSRPGDLTLELAAHLLDEVVTVDEQAFWEAMAMLWARGHQAEPAGAAGVAALLRRPDLARGTTAVVVSGGNLDPATAARVADLAAQHRPAPGAQAA